MSSTIYTICSAIGGLAGLAYIAQGLRAGRATLAGRDQVLQGAAIFLMIGSGVLPETLAAVRDVLVVGGCLLLLVSMALRGRAVAAGADAP